MLGCPPTTLTPASNHKERGHRDTKMTSGASREEEESFQIDDDDDDQSSSRAQQNPSTGTNCLQLPNPLRILFAFNGAIFILPNLALLSIVNNRASIPPSYLPAYGAISFLPWSIKPLYAFLSTWIIAQHHWVQRHTLIAILLCSSGLSFWGTAFIPEGGVVMCFVWGFVRGIASSWPEFLLGLTLIDTARGLSVMDVTEKQSEGDGNIDDVDGDRREAPISRRASSTGRYEEIVSVFQAQAATSRNVGSLSAGIFTFVLFGWRHYQHMGGNNDNGGDDDAADADQQDTNELSNTVVTFLLLMTGCLPFVGCIITMKFKVGSFIEGKACGEQKSTRQTKQSAGRYNGVASSEDDDNDSDRAATLEATNGDENSPLDVGIPSFERYQNAKSEQRSYCAILILFQLLLILGALKGPLTAVTTHVAWLSVLIVVLCLLVLSVCSAMYYRNKNGNATEEMPNHIPARRLALYLLLRHSLPSSGYVYYSFLFAVFENSPIYMQCLSILGSAGSTCSSFIYGRYIAQKYNSGWRIIQVIVGTTLLYSFSSFLNIAVYRQADGGQDEIIQGGLSFMWLLAPIYFTSGIVAEINFLPSLMLSTTNISKSQDVDTDNSDNQTTEASLNSSATSPFADEGMQYASFISCIDFAENIGSWITVPIVSALNITRENNFANLDRLIFICSFTYLVSLAYLYLIRPSRENKATRLDMQNVGAEFA